MDNNIDEIINENETLKQRVNELEERLKKYTSGKNHKKYYEKNKEKVMENGANYLHKLKEENPNLLSSNVGSILRSSSLILSIPIMPV